MWHSHSAKRPRRGSAPCVHDKKSGTVPVCLVIGLTDDEGDLFAVGRHAYAFRVAQRQQIDRRDRARTLGNAFIEAYWRAIVSRTFDSLSAYAVRVGADDQSEDCNTARHRKHFETQLQPRTFGTMCRRQIQILL